MNLSKLYSEEKSVIVKPVKALNNKIEYKMVEASRFKKQNFKVTADIELEKDSKYLSEKIIRNVNIDESDTTIINVGVGEGKTYSAYELIKEAVRSHYKVIVASPFISLTERDYKALSKKHTVTHYHEIGRLENDELIKNEIQIVTINSLIGNPGEGDSQSYDKKVYFEDLKNYYRENNYKVIFFFDEIHAGVENFTSDFKSNLAEWKPLTHKCIILSATFTESAYPPLGIIADLTDKRVAIMNAKRENSNTPADLHLVFTSKQYSSSDYSALDVLLPILRYANNKHKTINILTSSKALAEKLVSSDEPFRISQYLTSLNPNLLTAETNKDNSFKENEINIGTTFGTGFNISSPNSCYIILAPGNFGISESIFSYGRSPIVQAVARQRELGDIFLVFPTPKGLIKGKYLKLLPEALKPEYTKDRKLLENQLGFLKKEKEVEVEMQKKASKLTGKNESFNSFDFQIKEGEKRLSQKYLSYGKTVIPFMIWASMNDQFQNAKLKNIVYINPEHRDSIATYKIPKSDKKAFKSRLDQLLSGNIKKIIQDLREFEAYEAILNDLKYKNSDTGSHRFGTQSYLYPELNKIVYNGNEIPHEKFTSHAALGRWALNKLYELRYSESIEYYSSRYILDQIKYAQLLKGQTNKNYNSRLVAAYLKLNKARNLVMQYADKNENEISISDEVLKLTCQSQYELSKNDFFIKNKIVRFLTPLDNRFHLKVGSIIHYKMSKKELKKKVLTQYKNVLFKIQSKRPTINGERVVKYYIEEKLESTDNSLNFLTRPS